jgi:hypothetical protein
LRRSENQGVDIWYNLNLMLYNLIKKWII